MAEQDNTAQETVTIEEIDPGPPLEEPPSPMSVQGDVPARRWPPKTVGDLMTRTIITLRESEPIGDLEGWMHRFRFRHLPVVNDQMKLVGLITRTDFLHALIDGAPGGKLEGQVDSQTPASKLMRQRIVTAHPDSELTVAIRVMLKEKLGCLPVVKEDATLVGIITETDFVRLSLDSLERAAKD